MAAPAAAELGRILAQQRLPAWRLAFGYGSGVVAQGGGGGGAAPMVDVILGVDDAVAWHGANLAANGSDYGACGALGAGACAWVQRAGGGVFFNARVQRRDGCGLLKYGVVEVSALARDCERWDALYAAGRLQKPVVWVGGRAAVADAQARNLDGALRAALLRSPQAFAEDDLYAAIAALSYDGDVRFLLRAEDPRKVARIVAGARDRFAALYATRVSDAQAAGAVARTDRGWRQTARALDWCAAGLPAPLRAALPRGADRDAAGHALNDALRAVVRRSSAIQTAKGLATAAPRDAWAYAAAKRAKGRQGS